jgi:hypothetical protein
MPTPGGYDGIAPLRCDLHTLANVFSTRNVLPMCSVQSVTYVPCRSDLAGGSPSGAPTLDVLFAGATLFASEAAAARGVLLARAMLIAGERAAQQDRCCVAQREYLVLALRPGASGCDGWRYQSGDECHQQPPTQRSERRG